MVFDPEEASQLIRSGRAPGSLRVYGRLDLSKFEGERLPDGLHCYELDASGSQLTCLPEDLRVDSRLVLNNCQALTSLPDGLATGSISLRNCSSLRGLPENLDTWFLDLTGCAQFEKWPENGAVRHGSLVLRNCGRMASLPGWIGRLANLDLAGCSRVQQIPQGIAVSGWVDIGGTGIAAFPESLRGAALRWRGVRVDERIAFHPEMLSAREALAERNTELRRVMIERMGYLRFAKESAARVLDEDRDPGGARQLLKIDLQGDEALVGLSCFCPSTQRHYFLRVPPATKTCSQAAAWVAGFDNPRLYRPEIET